MTALAAVRPQAGDRNSVGIPGDGARRRGRQAGGDGDRQHLARQPRPEQRANRADGENHRADVETDPEGAEQAAIDRRVRSVHRFADDCRGGDRRRHADDQAPIATDSSTCRDDDTGADHGNEAGGDPEPRAGGSVVPGITTGRRANVACQEGSEDDEGDGTSASKRSAENPLVTRPSSSAWPRRSTMLTIHR